MPFPERMRDADRTAGLLLLPLVLTLAAASAGGCSYMLVSPPSRMVNIESAKTVAPGETVVGARGAAYSGVFDPAVGLGSVGVRHGVEEGIEVSAEGTWARAATYL